VRSADIVKNCREVALRVECSGEWGELPETLRIAATEIERLRRAVESWERESQSHAAEVERLRLRPEEVRFLLGVKNFDGHLVNDLLKRQGGGE